MNLQLPFWMRTGDLNRLRLLAQMWWELCRVWLAATHITHNPLTCTEDILGLIAWERSIERLNSEPLPLYRKRVACAAQNTIDGGSVSGFYRIFQRLGIPLNLQTERAPLTDWDIVVLQVDADVLSIAHIIEQVAASYGRTCRRYTVTVNQFDFINLRIIPTSYDKQIIKVSA